MIFISHSTTDDAAVDRIADQLEAAGLSTWVDHRKGIPLAQQWDPAIRKAIADCSVMVFVMSPRALASDICGGECLLARELGKPLYVVRLEDCAVEDIWLYIKQIQYADLVTDFDGGVGLLIEALQGGSGEDLPIPVQPLRVKRIKLLEHFESQIKYMPRQKIQIIVGEKGMGKSTTLEMISGMFGAKGDIYNIFVDLSRQDLTDSYNPVEAGLAILERYVAQIKSEIWSKYQQVEADGRRGRLTKISKCLGRLAEEKPVFLFFDNLHLDEAGIFVTWMRDIGKTKTDERTSPQGKRIYMIATALVDSVNPLPKFLEKFPKRTLMPLTVSEIEDIFEEGHSDLVWNIHQMTAGHPAVLEEYIDHWIFDGYLILKAGKLALKDPSIEIEKMPDFLQDRLDIALQNALDQIDLPEDIDEEDLGYWLTTAMIEGETFSELGLLAMLADDDFEPEHSLALLEHLSSSKSTKNPLLVPAAPYLPIETKFWQIHSKGLRYKLLAECSPAYEAACCVALFDALEDAAKPLPDRIQENLISIAEQGLNALRKSLQMRNFTNAEVNTAVFNHRLYAQYKRYSGKISRKAKIDNLRWLISVLEHTAEQDPSVLAELAQKYREITPLIVRYSDPTEALGYLEKALEIDRQIEDRAGEAATLKSIGSVWDDLGAKQKALDYLDKALSLYQAVGNRHGEAGTLYLVGYIWSSLWEKEKGLSYLEKALSLYRAVGDRSGEGTTLRWIGNIWSDFEEYQKALSYLEKALFLKRTVGNRNGEASTLGSIGRVWSDLGEYEKALGYYEKALSWMRAVGDRSGMGLILNDIGVVWSKLGEKEKALGYYEAALPLRREVKDRAGEALALDNIGEVWSKLGEKEKALGYYETALPLYRAVGDRRGEAKMLNNIGNIWSVLGEKEKALGYLEEALALRRAVGGRAGKATTLHNIGAVWDDLGEKEKALGYLEEALPLWRAVRDLSGESRTLNRIGSVRSHLGEYEKALGYYEEALTLRRTVGDLAGEGVILNNIGNAWYALGEKEKALGYYEEALTLRRAVEDRAGEAVTSYNIGRVYDSLGDLDQAITYLERCVALDEKINHPDLESDRRILARLKRKRDSQDSA